jgi:hypothetical protein
MVLPYLNMRLYYLGILEPLVPGVGHNYFSLLVIQKIDGSLSWYINNNYKSVTEHIFHPKVNRFR